ncbi:MAG TPA: AI-2E family transporter [Anaerolineales bacterium]|nr:AI-2E family transporter [Anaerolineales bacterium]
MKRVAWITALVLGTVAFLLLIWQFRQALIVFLLSLATAAALRPTINRLTARGIKPGLSLGLTYLFLLLMVGGLFVLISRTLLVDLEQITNNITLAYDEIVNTWPESNDQFLSAIASQLPPTTELSGVLTGEAGQQALQGIIGTASGVAGFFSQVFIIVVLSIYWSADRVHFERLWLSLIPVDQRMRAREAWRAVESGVGDYIVGELVQSYLVVLILWVGFTLIGLPQPALVALTSALAWFIPWLGAVLALIPVILIGLTASPQVAILASLLTVAVLILMEWFVQPRFFSRQRFNSLLLVLAVIMLAQVAGIIGVVLAPVLVAALQISFQHFTATREVELRADQFSEEFAQLQASLAQLQERLRSQDGDPSPELNSLMERMQTLLDKTTLFLESTNPT